MQRPCLRGALSGSFRNSREALAADVVRENDRSEVREVTGDKPGVSLWGLWLFI